MKSVGRPVYQAEQYKRWLYDLAPHLLVGNSLDVAIKKAGLEKHRTTIYEKHAQKDWFSYKIDSFQSFLGDLVNQVWVRLILDIHKKVENKEKLTSQELRTLRFFSVTHRSTIPFFVHKNETLHVYADERGNVEKVISNLLKEDSIPTIESRSQIDPGFSLEDPLQSLLSTLQ